LPLEEVAVKAAISLERVRQWEHGEDRPSISQLRKLGEV
jgi:transcriptional regulator with XRE-family HTH domain